MTQEHNPLDVVRTTISVSLDILNSGDAIENGSVAHEKLAAILPLFEQLRQERDGLREALDDILGAQMVEPYRGWNLTALNKATDKAREMRGLPSIRDLNPDIAKMQDAAKRNGLAELIEADRLSQTGEG